MVARVPDSPTLKGPFQPMRFEATVDDCVVTSGQIPPDLAGGFYRVGPTWKRPTRQGTDGLLGMDGMVQALLIRDGRADFLNRWVRTPKYLLEERHAQGMFEWADGDFGDWRTFCYGEVRRDQGNTGVPHGTANVNVFPFAGQILASGEQGAPPIVIDPISLDTVGIVPWSVQLSPGISSPAGYGDGAFCAHPKWDAAAGILYGWSFGDTEPYVTMHSVHADGSVQTRVLDDAPFNSVAHDIWLTPEHIVMPFQPFTVSNDRVARGLSIFGWEPDRPIVLALIPRHDPTAEVRWIETDLEPQYIMHTMSANVDGATLTLDGPIFDRPPFPFEQDFEAGDKTVLFFSLARSSLGRWTVDLDTGRVKSELLSDRPSELPKVDERYYGRGYRWGYQIGGVAKRAGMAMDRLVVTDMRTLDEQEYQIRTEQPAAVLEATFAPRHPDAVEGDGYLIVPVSWWSERRGEYLIFDTEDITQGPVCRIELPFVMGWTPHGHWMDFR